MPYSFVTRRVEQIGYRRFWVQAANVPDPFILCYSREWRPWSLFTARERTYWNLYWEKDCIGSLESEAEALHYILRFAYDMEYSPLLLPSEVLASVGLAYKHLSWVDSWAEPGPAEIVLRSGAILRPPERKIRLLGSTKPLDRPQRRKYPSKAPASRASSDLPSSKTTKTANSVSEGPRALRRPISRNWRDPQNHRFRVLRRFRRPEPKEPPDADCVFRLKSDFGPQKGPEA